MQEKFPKPISMIVWIAAHAVPICFPLLLLAITVSDFGIDWPNHIWLINYVGEYFHCHLRFPDVINTREVVGMPFPVFYGFVFYPIMGFLSCLINGSWVIRFCIVALWTFQYALVYLSVRDLTHSRFFATSIACLVSWSIYSLTNLYSRGAFTELFASILLLCVILLWVRSTPHPDRVPSRGELNWMALLFVLACGFHPITALCGIFLCLWVGITYVLLGKFPDAKALVISSTIPVFLSILTLAPWVDAVAIMQPHIQISSRMQKAIYYPHSLDSLLGRLSPVPIYPSQFKLALSEDSVKIKNIDVPINTPLLIILLMTVFLFFQGSPTSRQKKVVIGQLVVITALVGLSVIPGSLDLFGRLGTAVQFAYRLVGYINILILFSLLTTLMCLRDAGRTLPTTRLTATITATVILLSAAGATVKLFNCLLHKALTANSKLHRTAEDNSRLLSLPYTFYGQSDYCTPNLIPPKSMPPEQDAKSLQFAVSSGASFGEVGDIATPGCTSALTNVQAFAWNRLIQGNGIIPATSYPDKIMHLPSFYKITSYLLAAEIKSDQPIEYSFSPDPVWDLLQKTSRIALPLWIIACIVLAVCSFLQHHRVKKIEGFSP